MTHEQNPKLNFAEPADPWAVFKTWYEVAATTDLDDPNAMVLSTCGANSQISSRVVLCKEIRPEGLIFFTNYHSEKARALDSHPQCAINFFWEPLYRQVRMQGTCKKTDRKTSEDYWNTRPRERQLSQWVSDQSSPLDSRDTLLKKIADADLQFKDQKIPCPLHWGGFLFSPERIELWVGSRGRFHDRFNYTKVQNNWQLQRLYP
jgi:pyridoxamine 5'-phosphate oxidase